MSAMKALGSHDTGRLLKRVLGDLGKELNSLEEARRAILDAGVSAFIMFGGVGWGGVAKCFIVLQNICSLAKLSVAKAKIYQHRVMPHRPLSVLGLLIYVELSSCHFSDFSRPRGPKNALVTLIHF